MDVATLGTVDLELLESLLGSWAYVFSFRRPLFSLFFHVYRQAPPVEAERWLGTARDVPFRLRLGPATS